MGRKRKDEGALQAEIPPEQRGFVKMTTPAELVDQLKEIATTRGVGTPQKALRLVLEEHGHQTPAFDWDALEGVLLEQFGLKDAARVRAALETLRA